MLKVLLIVPDLHWQAGGDSVLRLALGLGARHCEVHVCTCRSESEASQGLIAAGVELLHLDPRTVRNPRLLYQALHSLRAFRPDVIHTFQASGNRLGRLAARLLGRVPVFSTAHVSADDTSPWRRWLRRVGHQRAARWIVPSELTAKLWQTAGVPANRTAIVAPGAALAPADHAAARDLRDRLKIPPGLPVIACVGPLLRRTGFFDAIWALDILRQAGIVCRLLIAGTGSERERVLHFTRALETEDAVHFLGHAEPLGVVLQLADIVWFPNLREAEPSLLLSAMAAGRAVVATRVPGQAEFIDDGRTGLLVPPSEQVLLVRQTCRLLEEAGLRSTLEQNAAEHVRQAHDLDAFVERQLELYRQSRG